MPHRTKITVGWLKPLHACRPDALQVVPNKGSASLIAQRKLAASIHPSKPAFITPPPVLAPPQVAEEPRDANLRKYNKTGKICRKRALHTPGGVYMFL